MFNWAWGVWLSSNAGLRENPMFLIISGVLFVAVWFGVPWMRAKLEKREETERAEAAIEKKHKEESRELLGHIPLMVTRLNEINGAFGEHVDNYSIHTPSEKLISHKVYITNYKALKELTMQGFANLEKRIDDIRAGF